VKLGSEKLEYVAPGLEIVTFGKDVIITSSGDTSYEGNDPTYDPNVDQSGKLPVNFADADNSVDWIDNFMK